MMTSLRLCVLGLCVLGLRVLGLRVLGLRVLALTLIGLWSATASTTSAAAPCTSADFAAAVDTSGAALRAFTLEAQPKLQDRMRRYSELKGLPQEQFEDAALDAIQDAKLTALDEKSAAMLLRIDSLGRVAEGAAPDCARLEDIKALSRDLLAVMKDKADYMQSRLDAKIAEAGGAPTALTEHAAPKDKPQAVAKNADKQSDKPVDKQAAAAAKPGPEKNEPAKEGASSTWPTTTKPNDAYRPPVDGMTPPPAPAAVAASEDGYSIDEIRDATRGFFGTISTNLASVIEHAFKTTGRPTAYVLGTEGGGAFFAGLRFGEGTLFMRNVQATRPVYWHGPSLGTDFGAAGSRTMFLIYKLEQPDNLFRSYAGVDGSAYFVGGVGFTLLKGGDVIMAPIRSGLGMRFGANIGYLKFSPTRTWNPF